MKAQSRPDNWVTGGRADLVGALLATGEDEAIRLSKNI